MKASSAERERMVVALREHTVDGRLSLEQFNERMELAYTAETQEQLAELASDLPARSRRRRTRFLLSLLSAIERDGRLRIGGRVFCFALFGSIDLDLREAMFEQDVVTIWTFGALCAIDVYVPEGVDVQLRGIKLLAGVDLWRVPPDAMQKSIGDVIRSARELHA